ncbi:nucleotidyltransferase family protein [Planktomarina sp.]|nr:nucleotidyltransferase family protein [Planktomarina sp.]
MDEQCLILKKSSTFLEAVKKLDENGDGVLPIIDNKGSFIAIITDGDVRRAILNNKTDLDDVMNKNPYTLTVNSTNDERLNYLRKYKIRHLPILDKNNKLIQIFTTDNVTLSIMDNPVVIMAGGLGSRLGELTKNTPKPMLLVGGRPILETILLSFIEYGFHKFYISVNFKKDLIIDYFGDGSRWKVSIEYLVEDKKLGTAGALSLLEDTHTDPIIVTNGDVITNLDYHRFLKHHKEQKTKVTMCVREYEYVVPYGVVEVDGFEIYRVSEKPTKYFNINAGIYVIEPDVLEHIPKDIFYDMTTLFEDVGKRRQRRSVFFLEDYWIDVGKVKELIQAEADLRLMPGISHE